ncbi:MAG: beta-eliminating lyase-related protein, partial [Deltaproteobacteria bacterium]|nr:beta-eliminating lyase-related protein [Deltaproteobacteria bacterium]
MLIHEPYKIKSVRNIPFTTFNERKRILRENKYNTTLIPADKITFDMTTQGTSAMSQEQMAALFIGDEAYAGAVNFYNLERAVRDVFGLKNVCPTHNRYGNVKLLTSIMVKSGKSVYSNSRFLKEIVEYYKGKFVNPSSREENGFSFLNVSEFVKAAAAETAYIYISLRSDAGNAVCPKCLKEIANFSRQSGIPLIIDASHIVLWADRVKNASAEYSAKKIAEIVKEVSSLATTVAFDATEDAMSNAGGFLATNDSRHHEAHQNEVVIYEGLHTYGGMAGRTMEVVAVGLRDMTDENNVKWYQQQIDLLSEMLKKHSVPHYRGIDGVYIYADKFLSHLKENRVHTLASALYLKAGIRASLGGRYIPAEILPVQTPRRALLNRHITQIGEAISELYGEADRIPALVLISEPQYHNEAEFDWLVPVIKPYEFECEPYTVHAIEKVAMKTVEERRKAMEEAGYNT